MKDLNIRERKNIRDTWKVLAPNIHEFAFSFYSNLHSLDSSLVPLFENEFGIIKQGDKALYVLGFVVASLDNLMVAREGIKKALEGVFMEHQHIKRADEQKVMKAFLQAMKSTLRGVWTNEIAISWYRLLSLISAVSIGTKIEFEIPVI
ncbi:hypothetical protein SAMN04488029_4044 [Reichenbachiella faecimaris]|uniref:Hemoglobin-like flavoprotein n=1 Tax=Reichenbachiella faecimaris TaxID=692418 RepID=A0A1W2GS79_REIFA|nr:hypothetical protein [Reichenbachiella faecimaris]SMD39106.1 hypothetical protein SAMN04488029_4044 [Reichenbachiella faecimaris]